MKSLDYWRLCDELSIVQAALLASDNDPAIEAAHAYVENWKPEDRPTGYDAAKTAITNALRRGAIAGKFIPQYERDINGNACGDIEGTVDPHLSLVDVDSLRKWLAGRGMKTGFFFPKGEEPPDYLDPMHPRYAPKLAAAVTAWMLVENEPLPGRTAKQILVKWLRQNAADFYLSDEDGKPNETGIEEAAKVANWQPGGGAPKTPGL
jgi:hypothetical protein